MIFGIMKEMVTEAKEMFAKKHPGLVDTAPYLGSKCDPSRISPAEFKVVKADGAAGAQVFARLTGQWKCEELRSMYTQVSDRAMPCIIILLLPPF